MNSVNHIDDELNHNLFKGCLVYLLMQSFKFLNQRVDCLIYCVPNNFRSLCVVIIKFAESVNDLLAIALIAVIDLLGGQRSLLVIIFCLLVDYRVQNSGKGFIHCCNLTRWLPIVVVMKQGSVQLVSTLVILLELFKAVV